MINTTEMALSLLAEQLNTIIATDSRPGYSVIMRGHPSDGGSYQMILWVENKAATLMILNNGGLESDYIELWPGVFTSENLAGLLSPSFSELPADFHITA